MPEKKLDYLQMVKDKEDEFTPRWKRNDVDKDLYYLTPFVLKNWLNKDFKHVINVTCNDPRVMADRIVGWLQGAIMQTEIQGKGLQFLPDKKTSLFENFLDKGVYPAADKRLQRAPNRRIPSLFKFQCFHSTLRGSIAGRVLIGMEGDEFSPDILPLDTRYFTYESDASGMKWGCSTTTRSKALIEAEYPKVTNFKGKAGEVLDLWTDDLNIVFIDGKEAKNVKNPLGYPPFVVSDAPVGSMFQDKDALEHTGESCFAGNRLLYPEKSRLLSILQTLDMMGFDAALQYAGSGKLPKEDPRGVGGMVKVDKDGGFSLVPVQDIKNSTRMFLAMLDVMLQRGGLPTTDYGTVSFPLSGSAIELLKSAEDPLFLPRLECLAVWYQGVSDMAIRQYRDKKLHVDLPTGDVGEKIYYTSKSLEGDYLIEYKFIDVSAQAQLANYSKATAAREWLDDDTIRRDTLKLQNPEDVKRKVDAQLAEQADPAMGQYNRTISLIEQGNDILARMSYSKLEEMLMQRQMVMQQVQGGGIVPPTEKPVGLPKGEALPLWGRGSQGGARPAPSPESEE